MSADDPEAVATGADGATLDAVRRQRQGVRSALDELERAVAAPGGEQWTAAVLARLEDLRKAFAHHVAVTEGRDGLFEEIMAHSPRLAHQIDKLRDEHETINAALSDLLRPTASAAVDQLRDEVLSVMGEVVRHRHAGASLIYDAYFVDIEAAD